VGISPLEFLIRELKRQRVAAGLTQAALGERVFCSDTQISAIETGTKPVTRKHLELVDAGLKTGGYFVRLWDELVKDSEAPEWLREWDDISRDARVLRWYEHAFVPGLLQTEAYARALFKSARRSQAEIDEKVAERMSRQEILRRDPVPKLFVVIDEQVVRRMCGSAEVMYEQVEHLITCAETPNIQLQVVPSEVGMYPGLAGAFIIADLPDATRVGYLDNQLSAQVVLRSEDVANLGVAWDNVLGNALPRSQSLNLLKEATKQWT